MNETKRKTISPWGVMLPGCMFVGMGLGYLAGSLKAGLLIGMGVGFVLVGLFSLRSKVD
jgi:hypothetical protein